LPKISIPFVPRAEDAGWTVPDVGHVQTKRFEAGLFAWERLDLVGEPEAGGDWILEPEAGGDWILDLGAGFEFVGFGAIATIRPAVDGNSKFSFCPTKIKFGLVIRFRFNRLRKSMPNRHAIEYSVSPRFTT
jgi:hypothetical protein